MSSIDLGPGAKPPRLLGKKMALANIVTAGAAMRLPNADSMMGATFCATSMPTSSSRVMGPTGKPNSTVEAICLPSLKTR